MAEHTPNVLFAEQWLARIRATRAPMRLTVTELRLATPMQTPRRGRPSKGDRELLGTRAPVLLAEAARNRAAELEMTVSDYLVTLIARDVKILDSANVTPSVVPINRTTSESPISHIA